MLHLRNTIIALFVVGVSSGQVSTDLSGEMKRLNIDTALVLHSQSVDSLPAWSADSRYVIVQVEGKWFKTDVSVLKLREAQLHRQRVGLAMEYKPEQMSDDEVSRYKKGLSQKELHRITDANEREANAAVITKAGLRVDIPHKELSSGLRITKAGRSVFVWQSDMENCYGLSLSPNGRYVTYLCELNGILVTDPEQAFQNAAKEQPIGFR
jgi:hypothetical protein